MPRVIDDYKASTSVMLFNEGADVATKLKVRIRISVQLNDIGFILE